jgi:hypothetical protein
MILGYIQTNWWLTTLALTLFQGILATIVVAISQTFPDDDLWDKGANWDAISAGVTLLLATYLPVEIQKHADIATAFQNVSQKMRAIQTYNVSLENLKRLKDVVMECKMDFNKVQIALKQIKATLNTDVEVQMDRYTELEDSLVDLKSKREFSIPPMYQRMLLIVVNVYYGIILPGVKSTPGRSPYYAVLDVLFVAVINNIILATGLETDSMFKYPNTKDFISAEKNFDFLSTANVRYTAFY